MPRDEYDNITKIQNYTPSNAKTNRVVKKTQNENVSSMAAKMNEKVRNARDMTNQGQIAVALQQTHRARVQDSAIAAVLTGMGVKVSKVA